MENMFPLCDSRHACVVLQMKWKDHRKPFVYATKTIDFHTDTGVKQCTFHWLISNDIAQDKCF